MTDSIDLDEIDTGEEESDANDGDWFWQGNGDPPEEPGSAAATPGSADSPAEAPESTDSGGTTVGTGSPDSEESADPDADEPAAGGPIPHVPYENKNQPAGIPVEQGGSGGGAAQSGGRRAQAPDDKGQMREEGQQGEAQASGPHGGDADDMTTAFTLKALRRIDNVQRALSETNQWSDWIGIVGDVESHEIQKFQRDHQLDVDFFNGTGSGPAERLAEIDRTSMFYAKRMVVVGVEGEEWFATDDEWEFVPLAEAAEGAGWEIAE